MSRIPLVTEMNPLLERTRAALGKVPNLYAALAHSPAALSGYLGFREGLSQGVLSTEMRERIALLVAQENDCAYCVAAHTARGRKVGLTHDELWATRRAESADAKTAAALSFVRVVVDSHGKISDADFEVARASGWSDAELLEMIGHVALNVFSNYVNHVAQPPLDFPPAPERP